MSRTTRKGTKRKRGLTTLKLFIEKLRRGFSFFKMVNLNYVEHEEEPEVVATEVPDDVKEGHFAVFAVKGEERKRFVIELGCLTNPAFLSLLEQAKEEYGFTQKGALAIPCRPEELEELLNDMSRDDRC
ncbi:protein SMALL AUXIN UP-REGULATED RNA 51-like [Malania oleifera]|uniref:protein SMALL AUXIN UP-REGULATED RNA 51-like n=1 Tax=Malania oleifera TaxID=397392 RepID=UPI0025AE6F37|nr:protein SMALL AUXIN UP-REGULATED RNA 51-like [Malania oleifera]